MAKCINILVIIQFFDTSFNGFFDTEIGDFYFDF